MKDAAGIPYYMAHAGSQIGTVAWDWHTDLPTSTVFQNSDKISAVIWNPDTKPAQVRIMQGEKTAKTVTVAPRTLETVPVK